MEPKFNPSSLEFNFSETEDQKGFEKLSVEKKKEIISESHGEANILKGKVELGETKDYGQAVKEFEDEFIKKTEDEIKKEKILEHFSLKNLKTIKLPKGGYAYLGRGGRFNIMDTSFDNLIFSYCDYENVYTQREAIERMRNLIIFEDSDADSERISSLNESIDFQNKLISSELDDIMRDKQSKENDLADVYFQARDIINNTESREEIKNDPILRDRVAKGYDALFENKAIRIELIKRTSDSTQGDYNADNFISDELDKGIYVVDALKKAEEEGFIKIKYIPTFYTDTKEMKLREDEINAHLEDRKRDIKKYIKERMERKVFSKLEEKKNLEEKQELIQGEYGNFLEAHKSDLSQDALSRLNDALLDFNKDYSHSDAYRSHTRTKGLDIKDGIAVFIVEHSNLNLKGSGGEEINIKLIMVDDEKTRGIKGFHVRDRWDQKKDDFSKWYDGVKIGDFDREMGLVTLKLTKARNVESEDVEKIDLKKLDEKNK